MDELHLTPDMNHATQEVDVVDAKPKCFTLSQTTTRRQRHQDLVPFGKRRSDRCYSLRAPGHDPAPFWRRWTDRSGAAWIAANQSVINCGRQHGRHIGENYTHV